MITTPAQHALGIHAGDRLETVGDNAGPYRVWSVHGPRLWTKGRDYTIRARPVVSVRLLYVRELPPTKKPTALINNIRRLDDGRWFTDTNREIRVSRPDAPPPWVVLDLFGSPDHVADEADPYPFQDGVDYWSAPNTVWRCERCGLDYNAAVRRGETTFPARGIPPGGCPGCASRAFQHIVYLMPERHDPPAKDWGSFNFGNGLGPRGHGIAERLADERPDDVDPFDWRAALDDN